MSPGKGSLMSNCYYLYSAGAGRAVHPNWLRKILAPAGSHKHKAQHIFSILMHRDPVTVHGSVLFWGLTGGCPLGKRRMCSWGEGGTSLYGRNTCQLHAAEVVPPAGSGPL